jgi:sulfur carrier protein
VRIFVNGEERSVPDGATVASLVAQSGAPGSERGVAVAIDAEVVPRSEWERTALGEGQRVEILVAIQGGA